MMKRREFIAGLGGAAACSLAVRAQEPERVRSVGVLIFSAENDPLTRTRLAALRDGLEAAGWTEGRNLHIDVRYGAADAAQLRSSAEELVKLAPDVIVTGAAPATRAVEQLRQAAPRVIRVALLFNPEFDSRGYLAAIEAAAEADGVKTVRTPVRDANDIKHGISAFAAEPNGGLVIVSPTPSFDNVELIFRLATQYRLPAIYPVRGLAVEGGLMAFGPLIPDMFRDAALYVDRLLRGAKPGDLPVQFPTKFELVVNLKAAREIGLVFPHTLIERAATVIE